MHPHLPAQTVRDPSFSFGQRWRFHKLVYCYLFLWAPSICTLGWGKVVIGLVDSIEAGSYWAKPSDWSKVGEFCFTIPPGTRGTVESEVVVLSGGHKLLLVTDSEEEKIFSNPVLLKASADASHWKDKWRRRLLLEKDSGGSIARNATVKSESETENLKKDLSSTNVASKRTPDLISNATISVAHRSVTQVEKKAVVHPEGWGGDQASTGVTSASSKTDIVTTVAIPAEVAASPNGSKALKKFARSVAPGVVRKSGNEQPLQDTIDQLPEDLDITDDHLTGENPSSAELLNAAPVVIIRGGGNSVSSASSICEALETAARVQETLRNISEASAYKLTLWVEPHISHKRVSAVVTRCHQVPNVQYRIVFRNPGNFLTAHFSCQDQGLLQIYGIHFILCLCLLPSIRRLYLLLANARKEYPVINVIFLASGAHCVYISLTFLHLSIYSIDGIGLSVLAFLGSLGEFVFTVCVSSVIASLALVPAAPSPTAPATGPSPTGGSTDSLPPTSSAPGLRSSSTYFADLSSRASPWEQLQNASLSAFEHLKKREWRQFVSLISRICCFVLRTALDAWKTPQPLLCLLCASLFLVTLGCSLRHPSPHDPLMPGWKILNLAAPVHTSNILLFFCIALYLGTRVQLACWHFFPDFPQNDTHLAESKLKNDLLFCRINVWRHGGALFALSLFPLTTRLMSILVICSATIWLLGLPLLAVMSHVSLLTFQHARLMILLCLHTFMLIGQQTATSKYQTRRTHTAHCSSSGFGKQLTSAFVSGSSGSGPASQRQHTRSAVPVSRLGETRKSKTYLPYQYGPWESQRLILSDATSTAPSKKRYHETFAKQPPFAGGSGLFPTPAWDRISENPRDTESDDNVEADNTLGIGTDATDAYKAPASTGPQGGAPSNARGHANHATPQSQSLAMPPGQHDLIQIHSNEEHVPHSDSNDRSIQPTADYSNLALVFPM